MTHRNSDRPMTITTRFSAASVLVDARVTLVRRAALISLVLVLLITNGGAG